MTRQSVNEAFAALIHPGQKVPFIRCAPIWARHMLDEIVGVPEGVFRHIVIDAPPCKADRVAASSSSMLCRPSSNEALRGSDMLLMLPEHIAQKWAEQVAVTCRPLKFLDHRFRYWVAWHSRTHCSPDQQWFRQFVYQHCRSSQFLSPGEASRGR